MRRVAAVIVLAGLAFAACGDANDGAGTPATTATATLSPPAATASPTPGVSPAEPGDHPVVTVVVRGPDGTGHPVAAEVVYRGADRHQGLMFREELDEDAGMLFLFPDDRWGGFWMHNTYIALDIAYIDRNGRIVDIRRGEPLDQTLLSPSAEYRNVLEMNAGWFEARGLGIGDVVELPPVLPVPE